MPWSSSLKTSSSAQTTTSSTVQAIHKNSQLLPIQSKNINTRSLQKFQQSPASTSSNTTQQNTRDKSPTSASIIEVIDDELSVSPASTSSIIQSQQPTPKSNKHKTRSTVRTYNKKPKKLANLGSNILALGNDDKLNQNIE